MTLLKLFEMTDWREDWQTIDDVDFAFEEREDVLFIFFQGSSQTTDWLRNFMFAKKPYKGMDIPYRVHRGFLEAWKKVEDIVIEKINSKEWKKIIVSGYSHGAALAAFCHECCWYHSKEKKTKVIGFGFEAPRIYAGFKVKKELLERWSNFYVIRNDKDIVTHCPPYLFGYTHVGNIVHIGRYHQYGIIKSHFQQNIRQSLLEDVDLLSFDEK